MSVDDARAAAPNWSPIANEAGAVQVRVRDSALAGASYALRLNFEAGRLLYMRASRSSHVEAEQACWDSFTALVEEVEARFGPLNGDPVNATDVEMRDLPSGSRVAYARGSNGRHRSASAWRDEPDASVSAGVQTFQERISCSLTATAFSDALWEEVVPAVSAPAEVASAPFSTARVRPANPYAVARFYPSAAMRHELEGRVEMHCLAQAEGPPNCAVVREAPMGLGFGESALRIAARSNVVPEIEGESVAGKRVRSVINFRLAD